MAKTIADIQKSAKMMADDNRHRYGSWRTTGNNTAANPSDGFHHDCGTGLTRVIRNAKSGKFTDNTPLSWYIWPDNDPSPYFDDYLISNGFTRYAFNHKKALASGYEFVPVVGRHHVWAYYSTSQNLQFELNDGYKNCGAESPLSVDIHPTIVYSDAEYMYFPTGWDKGIQIKNGLSNEPEKDGRYAYYTNGKIDTSVTGVYQNENGWWYVKNGYVDTSYWGLASNKYGTWVIEKGKVNFNAKEGFYEGTVGGDYGFWYCIKGEVQVGLNDIIKDGYDGKWRYVKGGKFTEYNGIAANKNGVWRVVEGVVDFTDGEYTEVIKVKGGMVMVSPSEQ